MIAINVEGRITFLNSVAESLTGWTQSEAAGVSGGGLPAIIHRETRKTVESPTVRALRDGVIVGLGNHALPISKDGTERHIGPVDDSAADHNHLGELAGVLLVTETSASERRQKRSCAKAEESYHRVVDLMPAASVYMVDAVGVITFITSKPPSMWGRSPQVGDTDQRFCGSQQFRPDGTSMLHNQTPVAAALQTGVSDAR